MRICKGSKRAAETEDLNSNAKKVDGLKSKGGKSQRPEREKIHEEKKHVHTQRKNNPAAVTPDREIVITRVFDAPRELVWKARTDPEHLKNCGGPKGFTMLSCKMDLRPGGMFHYGMRTPDGHEMWGKFVFREIVPPERLVHVVSFSDPQGGVTRHPMSATWPLEVLNTMTLTETNGKTTMTLNGVPINATEEERRTFQEGRGSMQQGFKGTLDQLDAYLVSVQKERSLDALQKENLAGPPTLLRKSSPATNATPTCGSCGQGS
ncbi:MAG: SRPBCC domain-containing protein [Acidobacteriia bacterium]|nr:SRPBCC domain-containing protein [Terriglobia bacterium]